MAKPRSQFGRSVRGFYGVKTFSLVMTLLDNLAAVATERGGRPETPS